MWEQIRANRMRSGFIVVAMGFLLVALGYVLGYYFLGSGDGGIVLALIVWLVMNLVALFQGDNILLSLGKARKVKKEDFPRLYNIVEEMSIASGLTKIPDIYVVDDPAPNAFATGRKPENAAVAVTSGLLQKLNRDELQGVVAHELGHIKNRDTQLMAIGGILLGTIVILAYYASRILFYGGMSGGRRSSRDSGGGGQDHHPRRGTGPAYPGAHRRQAAVLRPVTQARVPCRRVLRPVHPLSRGPGIRP